MRYKSYQIKIDSIAEVQNLVKELNKFKGEIDIKEGRRVVDGKSILGLMSLNLNNKLNIVPILDTEEMKKFKELMDKYK